MRVSFILSAGLVLLLGCGSTTGSFTTASRGARIAAKQNSIEGYQKFLRQNPQDPYVDEAKKNLASLLLKENDREAVEDFARHFPKDRKLVQASLDEFALIDRVRERMNDHEALQRDNSRLSIRRGEPYYAYLYSKNYVGYVDPDLGELEFFVRIERVIAPDCIKIVLLPETFALAERFHSMTNIYYKIIVSSTCPLGEYPVKVLFGVYRTINGEDEKRMGGAAAKHVVTVANEGVFSLQDMQVLAKSVSYYIDKTSKTKDKISKLMNPGSSDFSALYLYRWELSHYKIEIEKYQLFQSIALHSLKNAQKSSDAVLNQQATETLSRLRDIPSDIPKFTPF
jgi:hypothetical protein